MPGPDLPKLPIFPGFHERPNPQAVLRNIDQLLITQTGHYRGNPQEINQSNFGQLRTLVDRAKKAEANPEELKQLILPSLQKTIQRSSRYSGIQDATIFATLVEKLDIGSELFVYAPVPGYPENRLGRSDFSRYDVEKMRYTLNDLATLSALDIFGYTVGQRPRDPYAYRDPRRDTTQYTFIKTAEEPKSDLPARVAKVKQIFKSLKQVGIQYQPRWEGEETRRWYMSSESDLKSLITGELATVIAGIPDVTPDSYIAQTVLPLLETSYLVRSGGLYDYMRPDITRVAFNNRASLGDFSQAYIDMVVSNSRAAERDDEGVNRVIKFLDEIGEPARTEIFTQETRETVDLRNRILRQLDGVLPPIPFSIDFREQSKKALKEVSNIIRLAEAIRMPLTPESLSKRRGWRDQNPSLTEFLTDQYEKEVTGCFTSQSWNYGNYDLQAARASLRRLNRIFTYCQFPNDYLKNIAALKLVEVMSQGTKPNQEGLAIVFSTPNIEFSELRAALPVYMQSLVDNYKLDTLVKLAEFIKEEKEYLDFLALTPDKPTSLTPADQPSISSCHILKGEAEVAKRTGIVLATLNDRKTAEQQYRDLFTTLQNQHPTWQDLNVGPPFIEAAEIFGYRRMFAFMDRKGLSRHDALNAVHDIVTLYVASGQTPDQFYGNILNQVRLDDGTYNVGTAHHRLNEIAQSSTLDFRGLQEAIRHFPSIPELQELGQILTQPQAIFSSWSKLNRYVELSNLAQRTQILDELVALREAGGDSPLARYISLLLFHPSSKVNMDAATLFWTNPRAFMNREASHVQESFKNLKDQPIIHKYLI